MRKAIYLYTCDEPGCGKEQLGAGEMIRAKDGKHWCLEHYPYDICQNPRCGAKMRPHNSAAIDWPGTVAKGSAERCSSCHKHYELYGTERKPGGRWTNIKGEGFK